MKQNFRNSSNGPNGIVGQLATEKKKTVLAVCLVILMAFMWIKVFVRKNPTAANAMEMLEQMEQESELNPGVKVSFIKLPVIEGRHDLITRDCFNSNSWKDFIDSDNNVVVTKEVNIVPGDSTEKVISKIADNLRLEAFVMGENPRAYINDKILSVGDTLLVSDGADSYECEVILIKNNSVVIRCGKAEVTLKLKQIIENSLN